MNRKGEMTTEQIVILIVLIASFAVILFFIFRLNLFSENSDNICHNSVVARGNVAKLSGTTSNSIPLDCERSYICITSDKVCPNMQKPIVIKVKNKEDVYRALAEEMADCWWMFGEGKINYVGADMFDKLYCSICDQIVFDVSVKKIFDSNNFSRDELYDYLVKNNVSSGISYSEYFFNIDDFENFSEWGDLGVINLDKSYYVLTGMTSDISTLGWALTGAAVAAGATVYTIVTGGAGWAAVGIISVGVSAGIGGVATGTVTHFVAPMIQNALGTKSIPPSLIEIGSEEYEGLGCERISTRS